jgi:hypothetical protein
MARRKPFKGFKDVTFLNFKNFDYGRCAAFPYEGGSQMPSRLLGRVEKAIDQLKLSELPPKQREALEVNVHSAVSVVDLATEHQKVFPDQQMDFKDRAKNLRLAADILNGEREQFHKLLLRDRHGISADEPIHASKPAVARSSGSDTVKEVERLADLYEQSAACASERRNRAEYLATLHAWYLLMDVRESFWANECGDTKGRVNFESAYWKSWRLKRLPGLQRDGVWHSLAGDLYGKEVNFEYLQNLHVPLRKAGLGLQAFWEKQKNRGTIPQN